MKTRIQMLSIMISVMMLSLNVSAMNQELNKIQDTDKLVDKKNMNDATQAKLDPLTTAFIIEVGVPLASSLFNRVRSWFAMKRNNQQQANQNSPVVSNFTASLGIGFQQVLKQQCYAYIDHKVKLNKEKYQELVNQFGGLCDFLAPTGSSVTNFQFPTYQPQYSVTQTTAPFDVKILDGYGTNYQGLQLQIEMLDKSNNVLEARSVGSGFRSGERFRLKVTPTFTGLVQIQHKGSNGKIELLFPREPIQSIQLNAGQTMIIPSDPKRFYYFDDQKGVEQLIVQFIDYKGINGDYSKNTILRQDDGKSTYLMQEVSKSQYPFIIQTIEMQHQ